MKIMEKKSITFNLLNAIVINALLFNICVPSLYASQNNNYSSIVFTNNKFVNTVSENKNFEIKIAESNLKNDNIDRILNENNISKSNLVQVSQKMASGPGQTESNSFSINSNDNILDKFTGDMNYSIPLMDVDGFPLTITYNPNISMDQEASWVGLGWDLALGSINRDMRGIPDDFKGDVIQRELKIKNEEVEGKKNGVGLAAGVGTGVGTIYKGKPNEFSLGSLNESIDAQILLGKYINSYRGIGYTKDIGLNYAISIFGVGGSAGLGFSIDSQNGIGVSSSISFEATPTVAGISFGGKQFGVSLAANSREGTLSVEKTKTKISGFSNGFSSGFSSSSYGSFISYGKQTFVPKFNFNSITSGENSSQTIGATLIVTPSFYNIRFIHEEYSNKAEHLTRYNDLRGYGYFNYSESQNDDLALLDFNRDGKNEPSVMAQHLNFSQPTYDLFYCNAPGIMSNFRAHRYDIFKLHDPKITSNSNIKTESEERGIFGGFTPLGPTIGAEFGNSEGEIVGDSKTSEGLKTNKFDYIDKELTFNHKEYYLKSIGENTPNTNNQNTQFNQFLNYDAARLDISLLNNEIEITGNLVTDNLSQVIPNSTIDLSRKDNIVHYKVYSAQELVDLNVEINTYPLLTTQSTSLYLNPAQTLNNITNLKLAHHIQAIEVVNENGAKFFFGIPNYNYSEKTVTFSVKPTVISDKAQAEVKGIINYEPSDRTINNIKGRQNMYDCQTIPSYAHSFLLSRIYSDDYLDLTQNGPTKDDIGNYYKLNYTNVYGEINGDGNKFSWRMPISTGAQNTGIFEKRNKLAYYQENMETDPWDDVAHYTYGQKDLWYGQSIESKNMVAFFKLEERKDMYAVNEATGEQITNKKGYYLKKIELYSKNDLELNQENAKPIQIVEFEYDYSLCQNYPGNRDFITGSNQNNDGKLTLKGIYTYTGTSTETKSSPYKFFYATNINNPDYGFNSSDRWGNYKPNNINFPNHQFPFADQDEINAMQNIQAWKLKTITQPEGSEIEFEYAPDSYSFVQNKRAMRMFSISAIGNNGGLEDLSSIQNVNQSNIDTYASNTLRLLDDKKNSNEIIYFKLDKPIITTTLSEANELVKKQYFIDESGTEIDKILVNLYADLGNQNNGVNNDMYESVESVVPIEKSGVIRVGVVGAQSPSYQYGYIIIETQALNNESDNYEVSPLQLANWEFARRNTPYLIYGTVNNNAPTAQEFCNYSSSIDGGVIFGIDINRIINKHKFGLYFNKEKSQIRLFEPDNIKIGGNAKITSITYKNNWDNVSEETPTNYKWDYIYDTKGLTNGVATYEPQVGSQENPIYQLSGYNLEKYIIPDEKKYHYTPVCDMVYPSPIVGYSKIESFFSPSIIEPSRGIGKNVEYYHTCKEFPLKFSSTSILKPLTVIDKMEGNAIIDEGTKSVSEFLGLSEGFVVETNDMHGKLKSTELFDAADNLISREEYFYSDPYSKSIKYLNEYGTIIKDYPPREIDIYIDSWENYSENIVSQNGDLNSFGALFIQPLYIPFPVFNFLDYSFYSKYERTIKGYTLTKIINHSSIIDSIKSYNLGAINTAENILYDYRSGNVILSSLKDEFNDPLYDFSYPSHWKYRSFLNMNQMDGYIFKPIISGTQIELTNQTTYRFTEGDYFKIKLTDNSIIYAWVLQSKETEHYKKATIIDADGNSLNLSNLTDATFEVLKTGRKNRIAESMMAIKTKRNPFLGASECKLALPGDIGGNKFLKDILDVTAVVYSDKSDVPCPNYNGVKSIGYQIDQNEIDNFEIDQKVNPFLTGSKGNYQVVNSLAFQGKRKSVDVNGVRQDGEILGYYPFYSYKNSQNYNGFRQWYSINEIQNPFQSQELISPMWRNLSTTEEYDEQHNPIQISNQIRVPSSHLKILNENKFVLQEASASNAKYNEIGFDGFEFSSNLNSIIDNSFNLNQMLSTSQLVVDERHSGKFSLKVGNVTQATFPVKTNEIICSDAQNIVQNEYYIRNCDCIQNFEQEAGKKYFFSVWVKEKEQQESYANSYLKITFLDDNGVISNFTFSPSGKIIEGWQKMENSYIIPITATAIRFDFINSSPSESYYDDFRTHPFLAEMESIVYDKETLLPIATHNEYNFTTFYNYDNNHNLVKVKIETLDGIRTISEEEVGTYRVGY